MEHRLKKLMVGLALLALVLGLGSQAALADQNLVVGSPATAHLDFQITIPTILFLRVGSENAVVDLVSCTLSNIPGTGAVPMTSSGDNPVPVVAAALVPKGQAVKLNAVCPATLSVAAPGTSTIPINKITFTSTGDLGTGPFVAGTSTLATFEGSGIHTGTYSFSYLNDTYCDAGQYNAQVTYTLASP